MQYSHLIGEKLDKAKQSIKDLPIKPIYVETKDRYNVYDNKRVIRIKEVCIDGENQLEILYAGFMILKE